METLWQDLKYGARMLVKNPGFTIVAVLMLSLGIGANTAIFSLTDQVLLRMLPVRKPGELVIVRAPGPRRGHINSDEADASSSLSYPMYKDLRDRNQVFNGLLGRFATSLSVAYQGQTERAEGELVSGNYFETLGVSAALGRLFTQQDDMTPGGHPVAVLSHGYWVRRFGSDPSILNKTILVNAQPMTVVGVAQAGFFGVQVGQTPNVFVPVCMKAFMTPNWDGLSDRKDYWLNVIGRLKPGIPPAQAEASLLAVYRPILELEVEQLSGITAERRKQFLEKKIVLVSGAKGRQIFQEDSGSALLLLMSMVGLVLLIACANVANLQIARAAARQKEIAVRLALGAGRWRLVRQLLVESLLLSTIGGLCGLLVASWTLDALLKFVTTGAGVQGLSPSLDSRVLAFNFVLVVVTGILFGLVPALQASRPDLAPTLKDQAGNYSSGSAQARMRKTLAVAQVSLTLVLLITAGLFARSLYNLRNLDLGVRPDRLFAFSIAPELNGYSPARTIALFNQLEESLAALPGVSSVSAAELPAFANDSAASNITVEGYATTESEDMHPDKNFIAPNYFATMGTPLIAGREFTRQDAASSPKVCIINEAMVRQYFKDRNPLGRRIAWGSGPKTIPDIEIVGVVKDSKHASVSGEIRRFIYVPYTQRPGLGQITFYVRTAQEPGALGAALRQEVRRMDANLPVFDLKTLEAQIHQSLYGQRILMLLSIAFGVLAALLAAIGIYGVMSHTVARRTREIGIRLALGAQRSDVSVMILKEVGRMAVFGVAIGLPAAYALGRLVESLLYGVKANDLQTAGVATLGIAGIVLLAGYLPARRATRVDPMVALRYE